MIKILRVFIGLIFVLVFSGLAMSQTSPNKPNVATSGATTSSNTVSNPAPTASGTVQNPLAFTGSRSTQIKTGSGHFIQLIIRTDGVNAVTVNLMDSHGNLLGQSNTSVKYLLPPDTIVPADFTMGCPFKIHDPYGEPFSTGLYIEVITTGTCSFQVVYY